MKDVYNVKVYWAKEDVRKKYRKSGEDQITTGLLLVKWFVSFRITPHVYCCGTNPGQLDENCHKGEEEQAEFAKLEEESKIVWIK